MFPNESKMTANVCNPINKPGTFIIWKVTCHICSKIRPLRSTRIKYSTSFYLYNQTTALNGVNQAFPWCALPLSANHWVRTEWVPLNANRFWFHASHRAFIRTGANCRNAAHLNEPIPSSRLFSGKAWWPFIFPWMWNGGSTTLYY